MDAEAKFGCIAPCRKDRKIRLRDGSINRSGIISPCLLETNRPFYLLTTGETFRAQLMRPWLVSIQDRCQPINRRMRKPLPRQYCQTKLALGRPALSLALASWSKIDFAISTRRPKLLTAYDAVAKKDAEGGLALD